MARSTVHMDGRELCKLKEQLEKLNDPTKQDVFLTSCAKELAARLLRKVIKRTPVGEYPAGTGKKGGTLRRGWTKTKDITVERSGAGYVVTITNPTEYASYVEYGHRTRGHTGWVEGQFMLTISEQEIQNAAPKILEKKLEAWLRECFK